MKGYKTIIAATAITLVGALQQIGIIDLIPENYRGIAIAAIGLIMAILRMITNSPALKSY